MIELLKPEQLLSEVRRWGGVEGWGGWVWGGGAGEGVGEGRGIEWGTAASVLVPLTRLQASQAPKHTQPQLSIPTP